MKYYILLLCIFLNACGNSTNIEYMPFNVQEGDSISKVSTRLQQENIIKNKLSFRIIAKLTGKESKLKIGKYSIPPKISYIKLLDILNSGKGVGISVTIPEGFNIFQIAVILEDKNIVSAENFLNEVYKNSWLSKYNLPNNSEYSLSGLHRLSDRNGYQFAVPKDPPNSSLEGFLFPDTYCFAENSSAYTIVQAMTSRFDNIINNNIKAQINKQKKSLNEIITFASIIQKESSSDAEMPKVAGVYQNRLNIQMILQADPTLIYSLLLDGEYDGNIRTKHLRPPWPSPYNTYYNQSLPPGAIANPGKSAILAALNPEKHEYFYFVGDGRGGHYYSKTYAEHQKAVEKWVNYRRGKS